jgi:hypothetical protein
MNKVKLVKSKKRIPVPQKPPKIESNKKTYKRKRENKIIKQLIEEQRNDKKWLK